jgi:hypothetical protein
VDEHLDRIAGDEEDCISAAQGRTQRVGAIEVERDRRIAARRELCGARLVSGPADDVQLADRRIRPQLPHHLAADRSGCSSNDYSHAQSSSDGARDLAALDQD